MSNQTQKPKFVIVNAPEIIGAIQRNGLDDPIGGKLGATWFAYDDWRLEKCRAANSSEVRE